MLTGLFRLILEMVVPAPLVRLVPPVRHTNCLAEVTLAGTEAVHTRLNLLYGEASSTVTSVGWTWTIRPRAV